MTHHPRTILPLLFLLAASLVGCDRRAEPEGPVAAPAERPATFRTKSGVEMALLPAGEFTMGDDAGEDDQRPAHRVQLSTFAMDTCEVTQESFRAMMGRNPSKAIGSDRPVERVSWYMAIQYCNMRSMRDGLRPCYELKTAQCDFAADGYRLPTEAEWEYACRAGTTARWSCGDDPGQLAKYAWFKADSGKTTHPAREKQPNPWGLYGMHGNVAEWCNDFYGDSYDGAGPSNDPRGPVAGSERVLRGGSFASSADGCRSAARHSEPPRFADVCFGSDAYGFRCVRRADDAHPPQPGK